MSSGLCFGVFMLVFVCWGGGCWFFFHFSALFSICYKAQLIKQIPAELFDRKKYISGIVYFALL